ncbi:MAG: hypothetical protein GXY22_01980, partial [Clostridiaceae bacterium]|nr:hypothetical protein [Clostridiaceae bacterium]
MISKLYSIWSDDRSILLLTDVTRADVCSPNSIARGTRIPKRIRSSPIAIPIQTGFILTADLVCMTGCETGKDDDCGDCTSIGVPQFIQKRVPGVKGF